ncbi:YiiG family protein [Chryseobacterium oryctis]|uniref:YiiG family protein n=1 Tax=Chryseobacterium oryctis TaxID=2952618 RepID=A0ABT3HQ17_9FLAO|nr:YiiG family protein [Chryseobacterium oryctis]MCW3161882.1 YiiG family protein [Chryseobacterium oryctis]
MKKTVVFVLAFMLGVVSISCKKDLNKIGDTILNKVDGAGANAIIDFNNNFLDSYKKSTVRIEGILKYADEAVAKSKGLNTSTLPHVTEAMDFAYAKLTTVPSGFGKDKEVIEKEFQDYKVRKNNIEQKYAELKSYMNSEDFKDDKGAKAEAISKEIEADAEVFFTSGENIIAKIKPATDAAEEVILKDHPLKEYIVSSKAIMKSLDSSYEVLGKQYESKFNEAEAQKKYDEFAKAVENNSKLVFDVKDQQYSHKKIPFENINKNANNFLEIFRKLIRNAKTSGKISDSDISQIDSAYDSLLNSYNSFVR